MIGRFQDSQEPAAVTEVRGNEETHRGPASVYSTECEPFALALALALDAGNGGLRSE